MDAYEETFQTWNKVAGLYEKLYMPLRLYDESYDCFCTLLQVDHPRILELGCGPGNVTQYLGKRRPDFVIDAIDIAPQMIDIARKNCPSVQFKVMDIRSIGLLSQQYQGVICGFGMPYLSPSDVQQLIADSYHLLRKKGILYLSFVEGEDTSSGFQTGSTGDRTFFYYHSSVNVIKNLEIQLFKLVKIFSIPYSKNEEIQEIHTVIIAEK